MADQTESKEKMTLITDSTQSQTLSLQAVEAARNNDFDLAQHLLNQANESLTSAHRAQSALLAKEANDQSVNVTMLMAHAQDHYTSATVFYQMAQECMIVYQRLAELTGKA